MFEGRVQVSLTDDRIRINRPSQPDPTPTTKDQVTHKLVAKDQSMHEPVGLPVT